MISIPNICMVIMLRSLAKSNEIAPGADIFENPDPQRRQPARSPSFSEGHSGQSRALGVGRSSIRVSDEME